MSKPTTIAAIEITNRGIKKIVLVARTPDEMAETYRMLARATVALADLDESIKSPPSSVNPSK